MKELKDSKTRKSGCYTCKYSKPETLHGRQETRCLLDNMLVMRPSKGCPELKIMTNADRIRRMTDEEMAAQLEAFICAKVEECRREDISCIDCTMKWLKQEVAE